MRFWELYSICREKPAVLAMAFSEPKWQEYHSWIKNIEEIVRVQDRVKLDTVLPTELVEGALQNHEGFLYLINGMLRSFKYDPLEEKISLLIAFRRFGGSTVEIVLETGSARV